MVHKKHSIIPFLLSLFLTLQVDVSDAALKEFDQSNAQIDLTLLHPAGPDKDGIPAIDKVEYIDADQISYLRDDEMVIGVVIGNAARAYPIKILNWHEVINTEYVDHTLEVFYAVTWCPLTNTPIVLDRTVFAEVLTFGVSGLVLNNNLVLYDRTHNGLWSQMLAKGLSGPLAYHRMDILPSEYTTWGQWKRAHPNTTAMTLKTGHWKSYDKDPYKRYHNRQKIRFPIQHQDNQFFNKRIGLGVTLQGESKMYFLDRLEQVKRQPVVDEIGGVPVKIEKTPAGSWQVFRIDDLPENFNRYVRSYPVYWFAWKAFHPDTTVFVHKGMRFDIFKTIPFFGQ